MIVPADMNKITIVTLYDGNQGSHMVGAIAGELSPMGMASLASAFDARVGTADDDLLDDEGRSLWFVVSHVHQQGEPLELVDCYGPEVDEPPA